MKASEAVAMVSGLVSKYGRLAVEGELKAIREGRQRPRIELEVDAAVQQLGEAGELESILAALPVPAATAPARPRATKAESEALVSAVLERARALGSAFSSTELSSQLGKPVGSVSNALHKLVKSGQLRVDGTKRAARYSVVAA